MEIGERTDARKTRLDDEAAWQILGQAEKIYIAKGKKVLTFDPAVDDRAEILAQAMGRSGNLRASTLRRGRTILVGFNETLYEKHL